MCTREQLFPRLARETVLIDKTLIGTCSHNLFISVSTSKERKRQVFQFDQILN